MTVPVLQAGDRIHMAVPIRPDEAMIEAMIEAYADRGVTIFRISELSISCIEIISIIRTPERPSPMNIMASMPATRPR
jgi:hypothetical protein